MEKKTHSEYVFLFSFLSLYNFNLTCYANRVLCIHYRWVRVFNATFRKPPTCRKSL